MHPDKQFATQEDFHDWLTKFQKRLRDKHTAQTVKNAWRDIERANIVGMASCLLFQYAEGVAVIQEWYERNRRLARAVKTAKRALDVAVKKRNDPRFRMFAQRAAEAVDAASDIPNPNPCSPDKTLNEMLNSNPLLADDLLASGKRGDTIRREGPKPLLLVLRQLAGECGVKLGYDRLVALALAAAPDADLERYTLLKFAQNPSTKEALPDWVETFKSQRAQFLAHLAK